ncbi:RNA-directed DNA polymerase, eukaryota, reverse transcriptase zinc-binding domain protein, partial [Tanacetum coccineum]
IDTLEGTHHGDDDWTWVIEKRNKHLRSQQQPKEKTTLNNPNPTSTFTFYFMNFPSNWDRLVMKDVFARYWKVDDVFIARKWNVQGKRFGFAKFNGVVNPIAFEKELNTICIGTQLVRCNIAKYQRKAINNFHNKPLPPSHNNRASYSGKVFGSSQRRETLLKEHTMEMMVGRRYGKVDDVFIARKRNVEGKRFGFARFNGVVNPTAFEKELNTICIGTQLVRCNIAKYQRKAINNFHNKPLPPSHNNRASYNRKIAISGLPPQLWLTDPFTSIVELWGKVIIPEYCNPRQFNRTTGKVCILTRHLNLIHETICVPIDKELVPVRVYEIEGESDSLFNGCILDSSSDEDDPTYTWNGADDLTENNDDDGDDISSGKHTANSTEEGSTSCTGYKVKDKTKDIPRSASHVVLVFEKCTSDNNDEMSTTSPVQNQNPPLNESTTGKSTDYPINYSSRGVDTQPRTKNIGKSFLSDSNEVDNVIQAGNEIGFKMNRKECDVARILDDGDHNLTELILNHNTLSVILGDFNEVRAEFERMGTIFDPRGARFFNNFIESSGLHDIPMGGKLFTRMNNIGSKLSKLDRILVSCHFIDRWPNSYIRALTREFSYHTPLLLSNSVLYYGPSPFKFFNSWLSQEDFALLVQRCWLLPTNEIVTSPPVIFKIKLQRLKKMIKLWRFDIQCRESKTTTELRCKIDQLDSLVELGPLSAAHIAARTDAVRDLTSFEYIKLNDLKQKLSLGLWRRKASGPDGFTFKFIKKNWHLLENDIISYVKHFESSCHTPRGFNSSFITLVPKLDDPIVLGDYRPLSLIGCQYKIIAKVLANHLKHVLPSVVGEVQMAYIKGRQIIDGPLFVDEIISWAKTHKKKLMLFKVDFEKAFDSLSWNFLLSILEQMGFSAKWRNWICSCLDSAFASVLMNGSPTNEFKLESGLRQGDPLSLFLPILAVEALNIALIEAITTTFFMVLKWVKIRFTSPTFNLPMMPLV